MVKLNLGSVGLLDLLGRRGFVNSQNRVVLLLAWDATVLRKLGETSACEGIQLVVVQRFIKHIY